MSNQQGIASPASYDVTLLMAQTRKLAADYRRQTGHALPVTEELARFDAVTKLGLRKIEGIEGIDAVDRLENIEKAKESNSYLIKGRVIFKGGKARQKLGKLSLDGQWNCLLMVIYNADYLPSQIYKIDRDIIDNELAQITPDKRGSMTVAKYKAIGKIVWDVEQQSKLKEQSQIENN